MKKVKLFKSILNLSAPFCVTTTIVVGVVKFFGGGFPFISDNVTKYKCSTLRCVSNEIIEDNSSYETELSYDSKEKNFNNELTIYSPWTLEDNKYHRTIKYYDLSSIKDINLYRAIKSSDFDFINTNYCDFDEEIEYINKITKNYDDNLIDANIYFIDESDSIIEKESSGRNYFITSLEMLFAVPMGIMFTSIKKNKKDNKKLILGGSVNDD